MSMSRLQSHNEAFIDVWPCLFEWIRVLGMGTLSNETKSCSGSGSYSIENGGEDTGHLMFFVLVFRIKGPLTVGMNYNN